jgi:hypothetical protein
VRQNASTRSDAGDLHLRLVAAAEDPERRRAGAGEVLRGDRARGSGAKTAERVRLEERNGLTASREEHHDEGRTVTRGRIRLRSRVADPEVGRAHERQRAPAEVEAHARLVFDLACAKTAKALLDHVDRVFRREQGRNVVLPEKEGHDRFGMIEICPLVSSTAQRMSSILSTCCMRAAAASSSCVIRFRAMLRSIGFPSCTRMTG